jgi:hypothetical protein
MLEMLKAEKYVLRSKDLITFTFDRQQEFEKEMRKVHAHLQTISLAGWEHSIRGQEAVHSVAGCRHTGV